MKSIYDYIYKENIISDAECFWALEEAEEVKWRLHTWTENSGNGEYKYFNTGKSTELSTANVKTDTDLYHILHKGIETAINQYKDRFPYAGNLRSSIPRLNRYSQNTEMAEHVDHIYSIFDGKVRGIPVISIVGVLNDDYEGGEFIFNNEYEVRFSAGDILIFPSVFIYKHKVNLVTNGTRTSFVSWGY